MLFMRKSLRRQAVADDYQATTQKKWPPVSRWQGGVLWGGIIFLLAALLIELIPIGPAAWLPHGPLAHNIFSPVNFTIANPSQLAALQAEARLHTPPILQWNTADDLPDKIASQLGSLPADVAALPKGALLPPPLAKRFGTLSPLALHWLRLVVRDNQLATWQSRINLLLVNLQSHPIVSAADYRLITNQASQSVLLKMSAAHGAATQTAASVSTVNVLEPNGAPFRPLVERCFPAPLWDAITHYLVELQAPTYVFDTAATSALAARNAAAVKTPQTLVRQGQILAHAGETLDRRAAALVAASRAAYLKQIGDQHPWAIAAQRFGRALLLTLLALVGLLYVLAQTVERRNWRRETLAGAMLLGTLLIGKASLLLGFGSLVYFFGVAPLLLAAVVLVMVYRRRFAWGLAMIDALMLTLTLRQDIAFLFVQVVGASVIISALGEIRTRGMVIRAGLLTSGMMALCVWAAGMALVPVSHAVEFDWVTMARHVAEAATGYNAMLVTLAGLTAVFVVLGLLPLVERAFGSPTAMTLLELADTNHPLLRRLAVEAPGTFNHSLILGTMAEAAARDVGADALLCRVGAYYHDIGKLVKPGYFIENISGGANRHESLSPAMSLLIIVSHVKDGIELAREFHLPQPVRAFIAEHHGTNVVEPFYHAARDRQAKEALTGAASGQTSPVRDTEFRYPGPKPQSRETAILMLCDALEGTVRAMAEPTPGRIESAAHELALKRLLDGQFDQCDLTLGDLRKLELAMTRALVGVYHGRIKYPKPTAVSRPA